MLVSLQCHFELSALRSLWELVVKLVNAVDIPGMLRPFFDGIAANTWLLLLYVHTQLWKVWLKQWRKGAGLLVRHVNLGCCRFYNRDEASTQNTTGQQ